MSYIFPLPKNILDLLITRVYVICILYIMQNTMVLWMVGGTAVMEKIYDDDVKGKNLKKGKGKRRKLNKSQG